MILERKVKNQSFVSGNYSPDDAKDLIKSVIKGMKDHYKMKFFTDWQYNHDTCSKTKQACLDELDELQHRLMRDVDNAYLAGDKVQILGKLEIVSPL